MDQELRHLGVQVNANSTGNKVKEGVHPAVKRGSHDRFHSGDHNGIPLDGDSLDIGAGKRSVDFIPKLELGLDKGATLPFDDEAAFSGCDTPLWL